MDGKQGRAGQVQRKRLVVEAAGSRKGNGSVLCRQQQGRGQKTKHHRPQVPSDLSSAGLESWICPLLWFAYRYHDMSLLWLAKIMDSLLPRKCLALQMLIFDAVGLQIRQIFCL